jgi:hypothetical protein
MKELAAWFLLQRNAFGSLLVVVLCCLLSLGARVLPSASHASSQMRHHALLRLPGNRSTNWSAKRNPGLSSSRRSIPNSSIR